MRLICVGDSNTWGYDPADMHTGRYERIWPDVVGRELGFEAVNCGINGARIPDSEAKRAALLDWIGKERGAERAVILIMLGTNDMLNLPTGSEGLIISRMSELVRAVRSAWPQDRVLLLTPVRLITEKPLDIICIREGYERIAGEAGAEYIDCGSLYADMAYDGIHLSQMGHESLAQFISEKL